MDSMRQDYTINLENILGSGAFATVYKGFHNATRENIAVKVIRKPSASAQCSEKLESLQREVEVMRKLDHKNAIKLIEKYEDSMHCILVMDLVEGGELFDFLAAEDVIGENLVRRFLQQLLSVVTFLHDDIGVMHLDIKPENVLLDATQTRIKLVDFGLAHFYEPSKPLHKMIGTPEFVAPEMCNFDTITPAADVWAIGVLTYVMLTGYSPFLGDDDSETLANVSAAEPNFDDEGITGPLSGSCVDFLKFCLTADPKKRPTAVQCYKHFWLSDECMGPRTSIPTIRLREMITRRRFKNAAQAIHFANALCRMSRSSSASNSPLLPRIDREVNETPASTPTF